MYLLESTTCPNRHYIGLSRNAGARIAAHNAGSSPHTSKYRPWKVVVALQFADEEKAAAFERYLKTGSGYAFAKRHLW